VLGAPLSPARKTRAAVINLLLGLGAGFALPLGRASYAVVAGYVILTVCAAALLVRLTVAVRRGVRAVCGEPLAAVCRGAERADVVPEELRRISAEIARTRMNAAQYEETLGPRFSRLALRRAALAGGRKADVDGPREKPAAGRRRGMSAAEIGRIIRSLEES
jgi:hypothetical protein